MTGPLTALLGVTALTILAVMHRVRRITTDQQKQIDTLIDAINTLESRMDAPAPPPPPPAAVQPPPPPPAPAE